MYDLRDRYPDWRNLMSMGVLHDQECCSTIRLVNWVAECPTQPLGKLDDQRNHWVGEYPTEPLGSRQGGFPSGGERSEPEAKL